MFRYATLLALASTVANTAAETVSCTAAMIIEDHMEWKEYRDTAITEEADGPPGSGTAGGWTLAQCKAECKAHRVLCSMVSYSLEKTQYTPAGYCELWSGKHTANELIHKLAGINTYTESADAAPAFGYMSCELHNKTTLLFEDEHPDTSYVKTGDVLEMVIAPKPEEVLLKSAGECISQTCKRPRWNIQKSTLKTPSRSRRALRNGARTMLMINVVYGGNGGNPAQYCGESCMTQNAWTSTQGHLDGMIRESSYGKVSFPQSSGRVITVNLGTKQISQQYNCPVEQMRQDADAAIQQQGILSSQALDQYDHRVYYIPESTPGCQWAGLAYIGGSISWMKHGNPTLFAHEIGHNLGLHHASLDENNDGTKESEYGDHSAIMGNDLAWRGLLGANRLSLGWISTTNVYQWDRTCTANSLGQVRIHTLTQSPGYQGAYTLLKFSRGLTGGGDYYVSLRTNEGYDSTMKTKWRDQVQVKYMVGTRTNHVSAMPTGGTFSDGTVNLRVIGISDGVATVQICDNGNTGGEGGGNFVSTTTSIPSGGGGGGDSSCTDEHGGACEYWANIGECQKNPNFMLTRCAKSCQQCNPTPPPATTTTQPNTNTQTSCTKYQNKVIMGAADGPEGSGKGGGWSLNQCTDACKNANDCSIVVFSPTKTQYTSAGYCELWKSSHSASELATLNGLDAYTCTKTNIGDGGSTSGGGGTADVCENSETNCEYWASKGHCTKNAGWMNDKCPKSCDTCDGGSSGGNEPSIGNCDAVHTNRAIWGEADAGGSGSQSWTLLQCKDECQKSKSCVMATYAKDKTQWTQAGYCELWSTEHKASELQGTEGFSTYVCTQASYGVSPEEPELPPPPQTCEMRETCSYKKDATSRGRRPRTNDDVFAEAL